MIHPYAYSRETAQPPLLTALPPSLPVLKLLLEGGSHWVPWGPISRDPPSLEHSSLNLIIMPQKIVTILRNFVTKNHPHGYYWLFKLMHTCSAHLCFTTGQTFRLGWWHAAGLSGQSPYLIQTQMPIVLESAIGDVAYHWLHRSSSAWFKTENFFVCGYSPQS
jgi:hypothetical protein